MEEEACAWLGKGCCWDVSLGSPQLAGEVGGRVSPRTRLRNPGLGSVLLP